MGGNFTHYWDFSTCRICRDQEGEALDHTAGDHFVEAGVETGDRVYVVTARLGRLYLLGRMEVGEVVGAERARRLLGYEPWAATDHCLARVASPLRFDRSVPGELAERLKFSGTHGDVALKFKGSGEVDDRCLGDVRRLTADSARLLDGLLRDEPELDVAFDGPDEEDADDGDELSNLDRVVRHLREQGFRVDVDGHDGSVTGTVVRSNARYRFVALVDDEDGIVEFYSMLPVRVGELHRMAVAEALVRATFNLRGVYFDLDFETGMVRCRTVSHYEDTVLTDAVVESVINGNLAIMDAYCPALLAVAYGSRTAQEALEEMETEEEQPDSPDLEDEDDLEGDEEPDY